MATSSQNPPSEEERTLVLRLYVIQPGPNSLRALENLTQIVEEEFEGRADVEIVDIHDDPQRALDDGVLVTPTLLRVDPLPMVKIIGDLSDRETAVTTLRWT